MNSKIVLSVISVLLVIFVTAILLTRQPKETGDLDSFAKCLAEKGVTMYGAAWCPHCQAQKKLFGKSFDYVPYIECPNTPKLCLDKGVNGYPTWISPDGTKLEGEQTLQKLSEVSSCPLPS